jgi:hypothetical protein
MAPQRQHDLWAMSLKMTRRPLSQLEVGIKTLRRNAQLYEEDFFEWTQATAALIRAGKWYDLNPEALAEEVESLGKSDWRELGSRLDVLVMHLPMAIPMRVWRLATKPSCR